MSDIDECGWTQISAGTVVLVGLLMFIISGCLLLEGNQSDVLFSVGQSDAQYVTSVSLCSVYVLVVLVLF